MVTGRQHSFVMAWKMGWRRGGGARWRVRQDNFSQITVTMFVIHYSGSKWSFHENRNKTTLRGSSLSNSVLLYATKFWSFTVCLFLVINNLNKQFENKWIFFFGVFSFFLYKYKNKTWKHQTIFVYIFWEESVPSIMLLLKKLGEDMLLSSTIPSNSRYQKKKG